MKGLWTQGLAVLLATLPTDDELLAVLGDGWRVDQVDGTWMSGTRSLSGPGPVPGSTAVLALYDRPWPDDMGDPTDSPQLFGAWSMGHFGPTTYPGALRRSQAHARWGPPPDDAVERHQAFAMLRTTYAAGARPDDPLFPPGYDAHEELRALTGTWRSLLDVPGALAAFAPSGEVLLDRATFDSIASEAGEMGVDPLRLWLVVRTWNADRWRLYDTVGMAQLDLVDHELVVLPDEVPDGAALMLLLNLCLYVVAERAVIRSGETTDGPGGTYQNLTSTDGAVPAPPRPTHRWLPCFGERVPDELIPADEVDTPTQPWVLPR